MVIGGASLISNWRRLSIDREIYSVTREYKGA
jgi:hypothetical protein